ncbi:MAG: hypothetical protein M1825_002668 [Sarcosagium campestre]|nr:MAG: hypothetical protein M1825_002668 [Sarcosagium campestre]
MAEIPGDPSQNHPTLTLYLADTTLHPLLSSATSPDGPTALTKLTSAFLSIHEMGSRFKLGVPKRLILETAEGGPVLVQSHLGAPKPPTLPDSKTNGGGVGTEAPPPALLVTVVGPNSDSIKETLIARDALEDVGRGVQRAWGSVSAQGSVENYNDDDDSQRGG